MKNKIIISLLSAAALLGSGLALAFTHAEADSKKIPTDSAIITLDNTTFRSVVADYRASAWEYVGDKPAIVDFYADWCGPCRKLTPLLEELAAQYEGQIYIYKVDVDSSPEIAKAFGVKSIPLMLFIPMEGAPQKSLGLQPRAALEAKIKEVLLNE